MMKLKDKIAIVTGASQGIGKEVALALAKEGANVIVIDINDNVKKVSEEIKSMGVKSMAVKADVSNRKDIEKMSRDVLKTFGKVDILVNNAGIYPSVSFNEMKEEDWDKVMNVNLKGTFLCTKAVSESMIKKKSGSIINISSIAAMVGFNGLTHYCASKAGILGFTRALALELSKYNIRVNAIAPGAIETPGAKMTDEDANNFAQTIPLKRIGTPKDIASVVLFLASEDSSYITGQCIIVDGGYVLQ
jgi:3-oxoacyl-[acyl-carrier protein] reductase